MRELPLSYGLCLFPIRWHLFRNRLHLRHMFPCSWLWIYWWWHLIGSISGGLALVPVKWCCFKSSASCSGRLLDIWNRPWRRGIFQIPSTVQRWGELQARWRILNYCLRSWAVLSRVLRASLKSCNLATVNFCMQEVYFRLLLLGCRLIRRASWIGQLPGSQLSVAKTIEADRIEFSWPTWLRCSSFFGSFGKVSVSWSGGLFYEAWGKCQPTSSG